MDIETYDILRRQDISNNQGMVRLKDLSDADLRGIDLRMFQFDHVKFTRAKLDDSIVFRADGCDFSGASMIRFRCMNEHESGNNSHMRSCNFDAAILTGAQLSGVELSNSTFRKADLSDADLSDSTLSPRNSFEGTNLTRANLRYAHVYPSICDGINLNRAVDLHLAKSDDVRLTDLPRIRIHWIDRLLSWELIRVVGRLPMFGISYGTIIGLAAFFSVISLYNASVGRISTSQDRYASILSGVLFPYSVSWLEWAALLAAVLLAIASTIYRITCPARVAENTLTFWTDNLRRPPLEYLPLTWTNRRARVVCSVCYLFGGLVGLLVITVKLIDAITFMIRYTVFK